MSYTVFQTIGAPIENEASYSAAIKRNIIRNAQVTFFRNFSRGEEVSLFLGDHADGDPEKFLTKMAKAIATYGKLSQKQYDAVVKTIDVQAARKAAWEQALAEQKAKSEFIGAEASKLTVTAKLEKRLTIEGPKYSYYDSGIQDLYLFRDLAGNRITYKTKSDFGVQVVGLWDHSKHVEPLQDGDIVELTGTIKCHQEYRGEKQTILTRAKAVSLTRITHH